MIPELTVKVIINPDTASGSIYVPNWISRYAEHLFAHDWDPCWVMVEVEEYARQEPRPRV